MNRLQSTVAGGQFRTRHRDSNRRGNTNQSPLTHCEYYALSTLKLLVDDPDCSKVLSLPIGHHVSLQKSMSSFTSGLLETTPSLPGLDRTIVVPPRRLHLTLGVMSLEEDSSLAFDSQATHPKKTVTEALSLLCSLRSQISDLLRGARLSVPLQLMNIMPPDGGDPDNAHVLWIGPSFEDEAAQRLREVGEMMNKTFIDAGFIRDRRPLKLHCTVLNTVYRRPRGRGSRQPFSYRSLLASTAAQAMVQGETDPRRAVRVDFGTWDVDEIQICKMGSYGPEGEYESCGGLAVGQPLL